MTLRAATAGATKGRQRRYKRPTKLRRRHLRWRPLRRRRLRRCCLRRRHLRRRPLRRWAGFTGLGAVVCGGFSSCPWDFFRACVGWSRVKKTRGEHWMRRIFATISSGGRVACAYEYCDPVPALPNGYHIIPFTYPWVFFYPIPVPLMGFYPPGTRVIGTHCHPVGDTSSIAPSILK